MKTEKEELKHQIIKIVEDLNLADEKWIKKHGHKSYWEVFLDLFSQQKQEMVEEIENLIQLYLDKSAHLINEMDIGGDDKDIVVVDITGIKDILDQLKQKLNK